MIKFRTKVNYSSVLPHTTSEPAGGLYLKIVGDHKITNNYK